MDTPGPSMWLVLILLLALSAFFSASETSLASVNKMRLKARVEDGDKKAGLVMRLADDFDRTLSTLSLIHIFPLNWACAR